LKSEKKKKSSIYGMLFGVVERKGAREITRRAIVACTTRGQIGKGRDRQREIGPRNKERKTKRKIDFIGKVLT